MIAVCAWCEKEGAPAVVGEVEPLEDHGLTHTICPRHEAAVRAEHAVRRRAKAAA